MSEELLGVALECSSFMHEAWPMVLPLVKRLDAELNSLVMSAGLELLAYEALSYQRMRPSATIVCGLKLLVYEVLSC